MKKSLLLAVLTSLTATYAYADSGLYVVGSVGWSHASINKDGIDAALTSQGVTLLNSTSDESDVGYKVQIGYQFTNNLSIEGGYVDFGKFNYSATATGGVVNGDVEAHGVNIAGVYTYPIDDNFSIFGKIGGIDARVKTSLNATGVGGSASASTNKTAVRPTIGFGGTYNLNKDLGLRAEYELYNNLDSGTGESNVHFLSAGVVYKF